MVQQQFPLLPVQSYSDSCLFTIYESTLQLNQIFTMTTFWLEFYVTINYLQGVDVRLQDCNAFDADGKLVGN